MNKQLTTEDKKMETIDKARSEATKLAEKYQFAYCFCVVNYKGHYGVRFALDREMIGDRVHIELGYGIQRNQEGEILFITRKG